MKKVTIQDIADAMGISRNTVSKAINNSDGLADSTREKILQKAREKAEFFDSAPDYNGQSLRFVSITEKCELYDMSGDKTAKESIGDVISQLEDTELQSIWKSINK